MQTQTTTMCGCGCGQPTIGLTKRGRFVAFLPRHWKRIASTLSKDCRSCGTQFQPGPKDNESIWRKRTTCTFKCNVVLAIQTKTYLTPKPCDGCGNTFKPRSARKRFCSHRCYADSLVARKVTPPRRGHQITQPCATCGKLFSKKAYYVTKKGARFCSNGCTTEWRKTPERRRAQSLIATSIIRRGLVGGKWTTPERLVAKWITGQGLAYTAQAPLGKFAVIDFMVGGVFVEVQGCYWHACPVPSCKHYVGSPDERQRRKRGRDKAIATYCRRRNIQLLTIWEHAVMTSDFSALTPLLSVASHQALIPGLENC